MKKINNLEDLGELIKEEPKKEEVVHVEPTPEILESTLQKKSRKREIKGGLKVFR